MRNNPASPQCYFPRGLIRRAFSLVELMVVISIIVLLLAIAVPAFSSMLYSSEQSLAESSLRIALNTARDVAARSPVGQDSAAVFLYERDSRKMSVLVCTKAGVLPDRNSNPTGSSQTLPREVFAAAPGVETIQMTAGWTVRGFAPANSIDDEWYGDATFGTYQGNAVQSRGNWVFPETSFFDDINARADGRKRQTFMVRFEGGTGMVKSSDFAAVLVLSPSPGTSFRTNWPTYPNLIPNPVPNWDPQNNNPLNATHESDQLRFARRVIEWPTVGPSSITLRTKQEILGAASSDMILAKGVGQVALCNEGRLARALGVRTSDTGSLYIAPPAPPQPMAAAYAPQLLPTVTTERINEWIENRLLDNNNELIDSDCRVFTLQRYLGWLQEVTGTSGGLGVGS